MTISENSVVTLHYTVSNQEGVEIDSSLGTEPLVILHGHGQLIKGLEDALTGKTAGDKFEATVPAGEAYGERHDELVQSVPKNMFEGMEVEVGLQFRATTDHGEQSVIVIDVDDDNVIVDGNHPLAGLDLSFTVEILSIREATAEEIAHGHVHGEGGCGHNH